MEDKIKTRKEELKKDLNSLNERYQALVRETAQIQNAMLQFEGAYKILEELVPSPQEEVQAEVATENTDENKQVKRAKKTKEV